MKTLLITFVTSVFLTTAENKKCFCQSQYSNTNVQVSKEQVYKDFGTVNIIESEKTRLFDEVTFKKDDHTVTAFYNSRSELVGTTERKRFNDLPVKAQQIIKKEYKDYAAGDIILFDDNEENETDMVLYNQSFEDADNYFIELAKGNKKIVVESNRAGEVSYFTRLQ